MLARRIIACLDVKGGRVVKGVQFEGLRDVGDPAELAARYEREGVDEVVFLDISATEEERRTLWEVVRQTAERLFVPLTVGGGVRTVEDAAFALRSGADKVSINSAAVADPSLITRCAERFGAQCVVASIDARREGDRWRVYTRGGKAPTDLDAVAWAQECVRRGAGEILLTSIDRDGARTGYDLEFLRAVASVVPVPVIASGGAGNIEHVRAALTEGKADAALLAGILHEGLVTVGQIKEAMAKAGVPVRIETELARADGFKLSELDFDKGAGRVTVVTQDARTGQVLMVAGADRTAVEKTLETNEMHYTSRTRGLWHKGATSGNVQKVVSLATDCDGDAVLARVLPAGPACHEGTTSCFDGTNGDTLNELDATIAARATGPAVVGANGKPSYTQKLLGDRNLRLKKIGEEGAEFVLACGDKDKARIAEEAGDVIYHLLVAARAEGVSLDDIRAVLASRVR